MKPTSYKQYTEITPKEALLALAENDGKPIDGYAFRNGENKWIGSTLEDVSCQRIGQDPFIAGCSFWHYDHCAKVEEINPRDVPEGVTPLPDDKPWLAYVGIGQMGNESPHGYCHFDNRQDQWTDGCHSCGAKEYHYAIDVRTGFAKEHFPQIVACYDLESFKELKWKVGDTVEVIDTSSSFGVSVGDKGHVLEVDGDGDVLVRFEIGNKEADGQCFNPKRLKAWDRKPRYGYTDDGHKIVAPEGWEIVPEGEEIESIQGLSIVYKNGEIYNAHWDYSSAANCDGHIRAILRLIKAEPWREIVNRAEEVYRPSAIAKEAYELGLKHGSKE